MIDLELSLAIVAFDSSRSLFYNKRFNTQVESNVWTTRSTE